MIYLTGDVKAISTSWLRWEPPASAAATWCVSRYRISRSLHVQSNLWQRRDSGWLSKGPVVHRCIHTYSARCIFEATLVLTQLSFSWGSSLPLSSLSNNQQHGHHEGGRQTTAKDATISSTVTYPCWYAGWINPNCFQAILIHASHKCRMKCVQQLCTWCACCTAANPVHMLKMFHFKHIQKWDSPQKPRGKKYNNNNNDDNHNNGCLCL